MAAGKERGREVQFPVEIRPDQSYNMTSMSSLLILRNVPDPYGNYSAALTDGGDKLTQANEPELKTVTKHIMLLLDGFKRHVCYAMLLEAVTELSTPQQPEATENKGND